MPEGPCSPDSKTTPNPVAVAERAPRWVWTLGIIGVVLATAFVVLHLAGGGFHGHSLAPSPAASP